MRGRADARGTAPAVALCLLLVAGSVVPALALGAASSGTAASAASPGTAASTEPKDSPALGDGRPGRAAARRGAPPGPAAPSAGPAVARRANASPSDAAVAEAVRSSRSYVLDNPTRAGDHWAANISMGDRRPWDVRYTIEYALVLERVGVDSESKRRAVEYVLDRRDPDAGWNDTVANFAGLLLLEHLDGEHDDARRDVRAALDRSNASLVDVETETPRDVVFLYRTRLFYALMDDGRTVEGLFPNGTHRRLPGLLFATPAFEGNFTPTDNAVNQNALDTMLALNVLALETVSDPNETVRNTADRLTEVLLARRQTTGVWATGFDTVNAILALHEAGYEADSKPIRTAVEWLAANRQAPSGRFVTFRTPVWDTAWTVNALLESGLDTDDESVQSAVQWLVDARTTTNVARTRRNLTLDRPPLPFREHWGYGWGYKPALQSNWGDTAVTVRALAPYRDVVTMDTVDFLFEVQNSDGTWSTWTTDFQPLNESERDRLRPDMSQGLYRTLFGDEPVPDTNGHLLMAVGSRGYTVENDESVRQTVDYLLDARDDTGMWPAKWGMRYTYGTSRVILGLRAVGVPEDRTEIREAAATLADHQNPDGGWGEGIREGGTFPGWESGGYIEAPSTPEQTAWALRALLAAGYSPDHPAVQRGVAYLLDTQREDGSWPVSPVMYQGAPPTYNDAAWTQAAVLLALSEYADAAGVDAAPTDAPEDSESGPAVPPWLVADAAVLAAGAAVVRRIT